MANPRKKARKEQPTTFRLAGATDWVRAHSLFVTVALAAIATGVGGLFLVRFGLAGRLPWLDPALAGIALAAFAYFLVLAFRRKSDPV